MRDPLRPRRDPVPPAPDAPGGYVRLVQPSLFWREWEILQGETLLARIERAGWRKYRVDAASGRAEARFEGASLRLGMVRARAAPGGARFEAHDVAREPATAWNALLAYRSEEQPYPLLADHEGPLALFGDLHGAGFSAEGKIWAADRLLGGGDVATHHLAACVLILRDRPGSFRA